MKLLKQFGLVPWSTDILDEKYDRLTVLAVGRVPGTYKYFAICRCDCGAGPKKVRIDKLRAGLTTSCGCAQRDASTKHGLWKHPLYKVWGHMMDRCYNEKTERYPNYGGRGIHVCKRWHDVSNFVEDMESTYKPGLTIERADNDGDYKPSNCKWVKSSRQSGNRTVTVRLTHNGETHTLAEWARITGIPYGTLWERVKILGWPEQRVLTTPSLDADERCEIAREARKNPWKSRT